MYLYLRTHTYRDELAAHSFFAQREFAANFLTTRTQKERYVMPKWNWDTGECDQTHNELETERRGFDNERSLEDDFLERETRDFDDWINNLVS